MKEVFDDNEDTLNLLSFGLICQYFNKLGELYNQEKAPESYDKETIPFKLNPYEMGSNLPQVPITKELFQLKKNYPNVMGFMINSYVSRYSCTINIGK